jgi:hypothetical protein
MAGWAPEYAHRAISVPFSFASGDFFSPIRREICRAMGKKRLSERARVQGGIFFLTPNLPFSYTELT